MSAGQPDEDEITWGSDELPIENLNSKMRDGKTDFVYEICPQNSLREVKMEIMETAFT